MDIVENVEYFLNIGHELFVKSFIMITSLEMLFYGIFKCMALINIKNLQKGLKGGFEMSDALTTALTTAFTSVQTDVTSMVEIALPIGLSVMGLFMAIRLGIGFFRSVAN